MNIARKEIFELFMSILKFDIIDEVIKKANESQYGLGSGVFSHKKRIFWSFFYFGCSKFSRSRYQVFPWEKLFLIFLLFRAPSADSLTIRILNVHQNVPGVLRQITRILSDYNIEKQICDSKASIGYFMADVTIEKEQDMITIRDALANVSESILNRLLF